MLPSTSLSWYKSKKLLKTTEFCVIFGLVRMSLLSIWLRSHFDPLMTWEGPWSTCQPRGPGHPHKPQDGKFPREVPVVKGQVSHATSPSKTPYWSWSRCVWSESSSCWLLRTQWLLVLFFQVTVWSSLLPFHTSRVSVLSISATVALRLTKTLIPPRLTVPLVHWRWEREGGRGGAGGMLEGWRRNLRNHPWMLIQCWNHTLF